MSATRSSIPRPNAGTLRRLYVDERRGCPEIGRAYERDAKTVFWWLRQAGIQTRTRGSNPGPQFKKGERSRFAGRRHSPATRQMLREASKRLGLVPYLRNGQHWLKDAPPEANPRWLGGVTPERQTFYRSIEWKAACCAVWKREDACCQRCGSDFRKADRRTEAFHVHHIVSFAVRELRAEPGNLALLCRECHLWVHSNANVDRQYLKAAERQMSMPSLFDAIEGEAA